jgi:hypothetical protein
LIYDKVFNLAQGLITPQTRMSRFQFRLATPADESDLRRVLSSTPMNGRIRIAFAREPSYFGAAAVDGKQVQVGICCDTSTGRVAGIGSRSVSPRFLNGQPVPIGYLSALRILPEYRRRGLLLHRGYRFLKDLHADGATQLYLTTIADDNEAAIKVLTSERAGLPRYQPWGRYHTLAVSENSRRKMKLPSASDVHCRPADRSDRDDILQFLQLHGPSRQFFPAYDHDDLFTDAGLLRGLHPEDICLAFRGDELVGTMGAWDQRSFKQTFVSGYERWLQISRHFYNVYAALSGHMYLPKPGSFLNSAVVTIPLIRGNDPVVFQLLLQSQLNTLRHKRIKFMFIGLHQDDPLLPIAREFAWREFVTRLYIVHWQHEPFNIEQMKSRIPYLELGAL